MTNSDNTEVKEFIERVEIEPAPEGSETVENPNEEENETPPESSEGEKQADPEIEDTEDTEEPEKKDQLVGRNSNTEIVKPAPKPVDGETPREYALRLEVERVKGLLRKEKGEELFNDPKPQIKKPLSEDKSKLLEKYDPQQLSELREILGVVADDLGFVKKDEFNAQSYSTQAQDQLDTFLDSHPEYLPENDKQGILWNQFREEFGMYKQPENPKAYKKLFNKIHEQIFGIQTAGNLNKIQAQKEKIKVASHSGASAARTSKPVQPQTSGLRTDMLKGFSPEEIKELTG